MVKGQEIKRDTFESFYGSIMRGTGSYLKSAAPTLKRKIQQPGKKNKSYTPGWWSVHTPIKPVVKKKHKKKTYFIIQGNKVIIKER
jgi:hypothetical protein